MKIMEEKMKFLSLQWFKSKIEQSVENVISGKIDKLIDQINEEEEVKPSSSPVYRTAKLVNDNLTVILNNGDILNKPNATATDFDSVKNAKSEEDLFKIAASVEGLEEKRKEEVERERQRNIAKGIKLLEDSGDFVVVDSSLYMKNVKRSVPPLLVEEFATIVGEVQYYTGFGNLPEALEGSVEYQALKKFWLKCCLNPNARSAEDLYDFLAHHQFKIDNHGNFYAYRRVVSKNTKNKELVEFVSNVYSKVKAVWKKSPADYAVYSNGFEFKFTKISWVLPPLSDGEECEGNLEELYLELPNMQSNSYTSAHTGAEDYRIGEIISMPRNEGNDNNQISCSRGFHAASKEYDYSGFGDTPILVIINPMDVLAVPKGEVGKLRTSRWFFATILDESEEHILDNDDFDVSDLGDVFEEKCMENITEYVHQSYSEEVKRHTFNIPEMSATEISNIVNSLEVMSGIISKRVVDYYEDFDDNFDDDWNNDDTN